MAVCYDVVVVGGGSAGVAAAVGAAKRGARTLLIERSPCLGGASTMRNVVTYCGIYTLEPTPRRAVEGVASEVLAGLSALGALSGPFRHRGVFVVFDPEALKRVLDDVCDEHGVEVALHAFMGSAEREGGRLRALKILSDGGDTKVEAKAFVDCTGEANLAAFAGASVRYGADGEVNLATLGTRFGGVPADVEVTAEGVAEAVRRARARGVGPLTKEKSVIARLPLSGDIVCYLASEDYDPRDLVGFSAAERRGRRQAWAYLEALREIPGCERIFLASSGPEFGTRESRHVNSLRPLRWSDVTVRAPCADSIALGAWGVEWHDRRTHESTFVYPPDNRAYPIPLGCLMSADTDNLFAAGRTVDADRKAGASVRVMGTAFATGQAAGVAAAEFAETGSVDAGCVRAALRAQGARIDVDDLD